MNYVTSCFEMETNPSFRFGMSRAALGASRSSEPCHWLRGSTNRPAPAPPTAARFFLKKRWNAGRRRATRSTAFQSIGRKRKKVYRVLFRFFFKLWQLLPSFVVVVVVVDVVADFWLVVCAMVTGTLEPNFVGQ